jgi:arylsulfatase A-like enzyme
MMRVLLMHLRRQVLIAAWVGMVGGTLLGLLLGGLVAALENAPLLFRGAACLCAPTLLAALCAWVSVASLLPLALLLACAQTIWSNLRAVRARWLYARALAAGTSFLFGALWVAFRLVRDVTALRSVAIFAGLAVISSAVFLLPQWPRPSGPAGGEAAPRAGLVASGLALAVILGFAAYANLAAHVGGHVAGAEAAPVAATSRRLADGRAPDVILVSIDTLRADHLSVNGYARHTSPHLDQLATDGVNFVNARSQAPWTLPSHAALMVGRYPSSCGVRFANNFLRFFRGGVADKLASSNVTLAEIVHAAGFRTAAFTSIDYLTALFGFDQGFEQMQKADPQASDHAAAVVDKGIAWLAADTTRPSFLFLHVYTVHQYSSPAPYDGMYQDARYRGKLKQQPLRPAANLYETLSDGDLYYLTAKYDGALRYVDDQLGRLFTWLRDQGRYDHTLLVITSDHGEEFWEHGGTGHGFTLYEEQLRVPLLIKPPVGCTIHDRRPHVLAGLIDVAPTILDYLDLPPRPTMEGTTLRPTIETGARLDRSLFAEATFFFNTYAMIRPEYKYIDNRIPPLDSLRVGLLLANVRSFYRFRENELYQIDRDPQERTNLLASQAAVAAPMRQDLLAHIRAGQLGDSVALDAATTERLRALGYHQ